ncbi:MAG: monovalent cation/H(+) antiporter subunit G [Acetobacteraceae bacterium]|nr:monovalent cation/H(+) antiporter subunit G [Acetobacteraceae bacterium]
MTWLVDLASFGAIALGLLFFAAAAAGLVRFPDTLSRLHALAMADKLGLGLVVVGLLARADNVLAALKLLLVWALVLFSSTIAGQLIAGRVREESSAR